MAVLLVLTAMAWVARPSGPDGTADRSAATSTTAAATATTQGQASGDEPKNLLGRRSAAPA